MTPCELGLLFEADGDVIRDGYGPAAMICSLLANINRDRDQRPEPFTPADFLPGARTEDDDMEEFVRLVQSGHKFEADPEQVAQFRRQMMSTFGNLTVQ
jgi:hypothetical protein